MQSVVVMILDNGPSDRGSTLHEFRKIYQLVNMRLHPMTFADPRIVSVCANKMTVKPVVWLLMWLRLSHHMSESIFKK